MDHKYRKAFVLLLFFSFLYIYYFQQEKPPNLIRSEKKPKAQGVKPHKPCSYLVFAVSGGLTNQRLSITHAIYLAKLLGIDAIVSPLLSNNPSERGNIPLSDIFDEQKLKESLEEIDIVIVEPISLPSGPKCLKLQAIPPDLYFRRLEPEEYKKALEKRPELRNCTGEKPIILEIGNSFASVTWDDGKLNPDHSDQRFRTFWSHLWSYNYFLEYSQDINNWSKFIIDQLEKPYHSLHLRFESDWGPPPNLTVLSNQFLNLLNSAKYGIPLGSTIYIAGGNFTNKSVLLDDLNRFYKIKSKESIVPVKTLSQMSLYFQAAIDHLVCLESKTFLGNRRSSFDVHIKEERLSKKRVTHFYEHEYLRSAADQVIGHDYSKSEPEKILFTEKDSVQMYYGPFMLQRTACYH